MRFSAILRAASIDFTKVGSLVQPEHQALFNVIKNDHASLQGQLANARKAASQAIEWDRYEKTISSKGVVAALKTIFASQSFAPKDISADLASLKNEHATEVSKAKFTAEESSKAIGILNARISQILSAPTIENIDFEKLIRENPDVVKHFRKEIFINNRFDLIFDEESAERALYHQLGKGGHH